MFYFKKVIIIDYSQAQLETALRKASLKRTSSLDSVSSSTDIGTDKLFLGYESKGVLTFTRIKYFIEKYLPKLIIKISADTNECYYQIRFSLISTIVFLAFSGLTLLTLITMMQDLYVFVEAMPLLILPVCYLLLVLLEFKLTTKKINKALKNYEALKFTPSA